MSVARSWQLDSAVDPCLAGGGDVGALMRGIDWARTPLGPVERWPRSLKTTVGIVLGNPFPMLLCWGPELLQIYNDAYRPALGGKHPTSLGAPAARVWPEVWDVVGPMVRAVLAGGPARFHEHLLLFIDRLGFIEETFHTLSHSPVFDDEGRVGGVLVTVQETTEQVRSERQLRMLGELAAGSAYTDSPDEACRIAASVLGSNDADVPFSLIYLIDGDGKEARLAASSGFDRRGARVPPSSSFLDGDATHVVWPFAEAARTGETVIVEELSAKFGTMPGGRYGTAPERAVVLCLSGSGREHPYGFLVCGVNPRRALDDRYETFYRLTASQLVATLSKARAFEEEHRRAEVIAELDRAKTAFFNGVSHELRTPLTLILGLVEDAMAAPKPALSSGELTMLHRNALRLNKLVDTILDFARLESGHVRASFEPTDVAALTRELAEAFRPAMDGAGLAFKVHSEPLPDAVHVDREMWEKIVFNLLSNALKFTLEGSVTVSVTWHGDHVALTVHDTGTGIPGDDLPLVFERFHRVRNARGRTHEGSGIGLSLVQELVRLHGGTIHVESELGRGSTFTVSIPTGTSHLPADRIAVARSPARASANPYVEEALQWLPEPPEPVTPKVPAAPVDPNARLLLVDDNADMREYMRRVLSVHFTVETAPDGVAALKAAEERPPDVVLTDVMMPRMDGFELLDALRAREATASIPVIMLSARSGEDARIEGLHAGADDYLEKPFSRRELVARVRVHLTLARLRSKLERERNSLKRLFQQTPVAINFLRGPDLVVEAAHPKTVERLGGREIEGKALLDAVPELRDQVCTALLREVYETGKPRVGTEAKVQFHPLQAGGSAETYWNYSFLPVRDSEGQIEGVMTCDVEVTDQVLARRALRDSEERLRLAMDASALGDWEVDLNTQTATTSARHDSIFGYTTAQPNRTEENMLARVVEEDRAAVASAFHAAIERRADIHIQCRIRRTDGEVRWVEIQGRLYLDDDGVPAKMLGTVGDITKRKAIDEERAQFVARADEARQIAEDATRAKDEFLAMLGHELRNPLSPIVTATHLLRLRGVDGRELSIIERQLRQLVRLVDDLLDVSRITRGKIELRKERLELCDIVARAIETSSPLLEHRHHTLDVSVPHGLVLNGDAARLAQVVANLLTNAAKYSDEGSTIHISARRLGDLVELRVKDHGMGIRRELLEKVFDLFMQQPQSNDRAHGGLGLGLAIVRNLVKTHGGSVRAESEGIGRGSEFIVELPIAAPVESVNEGPLAEPDSEAASTPTGRRILVVDDNEDAAEMLKELLTMTGHVCAIAHDGPSALAVAEKFLPDVALLDIGLPVMDGYELAARLRASPFGQSIILIAVSGYGQARDRDASKKAGFAEHVVKPVDIERLEQLISSPDLSSAP